MDRKVIGERLARLRGRRSQMEVAKELGISDSALSAYENGERTPRDEVKVRIAEFYKTTVQAIFFDP
ncbi:MAG: helix-turn-helix transcriptional regulator [Lachnospiraceae bacterium]|nr:helix-turn-helix transcriptional regulator [Lachnospiraceae bacterium]MBR0086393.1 helix-turn-helix transcriptional regulator [Lachnospiraceae bacterium]